MTDLAALLSKTMHALDFDASEERRRELEAEKAAELARHAAKLAARTAKAIALSGIDVDGDMRQRIATGRIEPTPALKATRSWWQAFTQKRTPRTLVLLSTVGVGKSVAAAWAVGRCGSGMAMMARDAELAYASQWGPQRERWEAFLGCRLAIVNELKTERNVETAVGMVEELVGIRHARGLPTMLVGNLPRAEFEARYGGSTDDARASSRLLSRLAEHGRIESWRGADMRRVGR